MNKEAKRMEAKKIILMFLTTLCLCFTSFDLISCRSSEYDDYTKGLVFDYCHQFDSTTYKVIGYESSMGFLEGSGTYSIDGNKLTSILTSPDGSQSKQVRTFEVTKDKFINIYAKDNNIPFGIAMFDENNLIGFLVFKESDEKNGS